MFAVSPNYDITKLQSGRREVQNRGVDDQKNGLAAGASPRLLSSAYPSSQHAGFAILSLIGSYFEAIASFIEGQSSENQSGKFFGIGFRSVFPEFESQVVARGAVDVDGELKRLSTAYYREVRCGLFHEAMTRAGTVIVRGAAHAASNTRTRHQRSSSSKSTRFLCSIASNNTSTSTSPTSRNGTDVQQLEHFEREWSRRTAP